MMDDRWEGHVWYAGYLKVLTYTKRFLDSDRAPEGKAGYYDLISIQTPKPKGGTQ